MVTECVKPVRIGCEQDWLIQARSRATIKNNQDGCRTSDTLDQEFQPKQAIHSFLTPRHVFLMSLVRTGLAAALPTSQSSSLIGCMSIQVSRGSYFCVCWDFPLEIRVKSEGISRDQLTKSKRVIIESKAQCSSRARVARLIICIEEEKD